MAEYILMLIKFIKLLHGYLLIRKSDLFDKDWYLANNPDVAQAKANLWLHYLRYGGFEGRDPGPKFNSEWYLDTYEDVKKSNINPLVHFLKHGQAEKRTTQPSSNLVMINNSSSRKTNQTVEAPVKAGTQKIFCIGYNKTGTTSLEQVLKDFGYKVGDQWDAELLMDDWARRDFRRIVEYCQTADAFQDVPFSLDFTYPVLDYAFPGSKFILTIRKDADEWYESLVRFHAKLMGVKGTPTIDDVKNFSYHEKGWGWIQQQRIFGSTEATLYDEKLYKSCYTNHNAQILEYFRLRQDDLLVLNLADPSAMQSLCKFLNIKYIGQPMPHLNKSNE